MKPLIGILALFIALGGAAVGDTRSAESAIRQYHFTKYHHAVQTPWSVQAGPYVIVAWNDTNTGGTALLRTTPRLTLIIDGGGYMNAQEMQKRGVPRQFATQLYREQRAELQRPR